MKPTKMPARMTSDMTAWCASINALSASIMSAVLRAVEQFMVGEDKRHHRLDHRRAANADTRIVAALGHDIGRLARLVHRRHRGQDRTGRLERDAHDHRLPGRDAARRAPRGGPPGNLTVASL